MVNNNGVDEVLVEIESSNKIMVEERLGLQRANFPRDLNGVKTPIEMCIRDRSCNVWLARRKFVPLSENICAGIPPVSYTHLQVTVYRGDLLKFIIS